MAVKRLDRINEEVKKTLSDIIRELKDPRVSPMTTVLAVDVTNDFKQAKVKVSVYDNDDARKETLEALTNAAGFIGRELGARMDIRRIPRFMFYLDNSIEYSVHISQILSKLNITGGEEDGQESDN